MEPYRDLREWLERVDEIRELKRIPEQVDWDEEMAAITYLAAKQEGGPALLFENVKDHGNGDRVLGNILGTSLRRIAITLGLPLDLSAMEMIARTKEVFKKRIPPELVDDADAPINENVLLGDEIDITRFPAPKMWPLDGGRYIGTGDITITKDPDDGRLNLGTYRQMVHSKNRIGLYVSPGKDALLHREKWWARGEPMEVAAAYGIDPVLFVVGAMGFPKNVSEYDAAGGVKGRPIRVVKGKVTDLLVPADAEIVVEGVVQPGQFLEEGPFGEFTGYYGRPGGPTPYIEIKCIRYRTNPVLTTALMADHPSCEQNLFFGIARSARIWEDLDSLGIPGIKGVYSVPAAAGGFGMVVVSIEQKHAGHAAQVLALAAQCAGGSYYTKWIVVVDDDVDPTDMNQVLWAMTTRCNPSQDLDILRNTWSTYLDPTQNPPENRPYGSKALINACMEHRYLHTFSKRTFLREATYHKVQ
ncbi:MAG: UbiD family decarboxylase, partial [bacterium]